MAEYEKLIIPVDILNGESSEKILGSIVQRLEEISTVSNSVGYTTKEYNALSREFKDCAKNVTILSKMVQELNKTNSTAALQQEKVSQAMQKTAQDTQKTAQALEKTKAMQNANALSAEKLNTQLAQTALMQSKTEMAALRVAQAHEKQTQKAQQAVRPYNMLNQQLREQAQKLQDAIAANNVHGAALTSMVDKYHRLHDKLDTTNKKFQELTATQKENKNVMDILKIAFGSFLGMLGNQVLMKATQMFKEFAASVSKAGIELDALQNTMLAATGGWESGKREMNWLIEMSNKLGIAFGDVSDSYAKFMTSFTRSGGTISQSRQIFEDLSTAMVSLHLPAERMQGVFIALEQMANKGTVQAEELKRQLGNALPGAFELAAESMGILPARLMDMMKKGEVFSKDFLPAFAATVKMALGQSIDIASMQFNASMNRLSTATELLKMNVGQMVNEALLPLVNGLVVVMNGLAKTAKFFNENKVASSLLKGALVGLLATVVAFNFGAIVAGITAIGTAITTIVLPALAVLNVALGGLPLIIGAVVTGVAALGFHLADSAKKAADITPYIGLSTQIVNLTKEISNLDTTTDEGKKKLEEYKKTFPELTEYLSTTGKRFQDLSNDELKHIAVLGEHDAKMRALNERSQELASWQSFLSAACAVAWEKIGILAKALYRTVEQAFYGMIDNTQKVMNWFGEAVRKVGSLTNKIGVGIEKLGQATHVDFWVAEGKAIQTASEYLIDWDGTVNKVKKGIVDFGNTVKDNWEKSAFVTEVNAKRMSTANQNYIKKLEVIQKNSKLTYDSLVQAQSAVGGLQTGSAGASGGSKKVKGGSKEQAEDEWQALNKKKEAVLEQIRVNKLLGKDTSDLEKVYLEYQTQIDKVTESIKALTKHEKEVNMTAAEQAIKLWDDKRKALQNAEKQYKGMMLAGDNYTESELKQQRATMKTLKAEVAYVKRLEERENLMQISNRAAQQLSNSLIDGIFEPLKEGETLWDRFKEAGISALKSIAAAWTKSLMNDIATGFQAGFRTGSGGLLGSLINGIKGAFLLTQGQMLPSLVSGTQANVAASSTSAVSNAVANVANSSGVAATTVGALGTTLLAAQPAILACTPALTAMAGAMTAIAKSASTAATSMAAYAVSAAAASVATIPYLGAVLAPAAALATGAAIAAGTALTGAAIAAGSVMAGAGQMVGGAMSGIGNKLSGTSVVPHAKGGIVSSPTMFAMQGGNIGLAGEAGTEVIAPARRMSNGDVGIGAVQPKVTVNNYTNSAVEVIKRPDNEMEIKITELNAMLSSSRTNKGWASAQSRMSNKGRQIG